MNEAYKTLEQLGYNDIEIVYKKERLRFAYGQYSKAGKGPITGKDHPNRISLRGNEPSLIRLGLAYLLVHELGHHEYRKENDPHENEDFTDGFKIKERELLERFWQICLDSDKEIKDEGG